jgi:hypothetical protein
LSPEANSTLAVIKFDEIIPRGGQNTGLEQQMKVSINEKLNQARPYLLPFFPDSNRITLGYSLHESPQRNNERCENRSFLFVVDDFFVQTHYRV